MLDFNKVTVSVIDELNEIERNFKSDILVLSCTLYRLVTSSDTNGRYIVWSLTDYQDILINEVTDEDTNLAEEISKYYIGKLLVKKLKTETLSKYRNDLLQYLTDRPTVVTDIFVRMIYKLPYFYHCDRKLIEIFGGPQRDLVEYKSNKDTIPLKFISKLDTKRKTHRNYQYWFKDQQDNRVLLELEKTNPILHLWEQTINDTDIVVCGKFKRKNMDDMNYYVASGWKIDVSEN